jgi:3-hydroxybutyryl-CoA dehydrogenase
MDLIGLDTNFAITGAIYGALGRPERFQPPEIQKQLVLKGMTGRKADKGFYLYQDGKKTTENPESVRLLTNGPALNGNEVWTRLRTAIVHEAEILVAEGTAMQSDVDTAIKLAMNFPKGPFEWRKESTVA